MVELCYNNNKQHLIVATTHLKAKSEFESLRVKQVTELLSAINEFNCDGYPLVFAGDLNTEPSGEVYPLILNQGFSSSYHDAKFTTYKIRNNRDNGGESEFCRTIDYIFYRNLTCIDVIPLPTKEEIGPNGLPTETHPSDHLNLTAKFSLNK